MEIRIVKTKILVMVAFLTAISGPVSAGTLDKLFGPKQYQLSVCDTEEAARQCDKDCRPNSVGHVEFKINQSDRTVAIKYVLPNAQETKIEVYHKCDIFDNSYWNCEENTGYGDQKNNRSFTKNIKSTGDLIIVTTSDSMTIDGDTKEYKGWNECFK